jgi:hypothetical protein
MKNPNFHVLVYVPADLCGAMYECNACLCLSIVVWLILFYDEACVCIIFILSMGSTYIYVIYAQPIARPHRPNQLRATELMCTWAEPG